MVPAKKSPCKQRKLSAWRQETAVVYARPERRFGHVRHQRHNVDDRALLRVWIEKHLDTMVMARFQPGIQYDVSREMVKAV